MAGSGWRENVLSMTPAEPGWLAYVSDRKDPSRNALAPIIGWAVMEELFETEHAFDEYGSGTAVLYNHDGKPVPHRSIEPVFVYNSEGPEIASSPYCDFYIEAILAPGAGRPADVPLAPVLWAEWSG